jgi:hypothetical protein
MFTFANNVTNCCVAGHRWKGTHSCIPMATLNTIVFLTATSILNISSTESIVAFPFQQWFPECTTKKHFTTSFTLFPPRTPATLTRHSYRPAPHTEGLPQFSNLFFFRHSSCKLYTCQTWTAVPHALYMSVTLTLRQFLLCDPTNCVQATFETILTGHTQSVGGGMV